MKIVKLYILLFGFAPFCLLSQKENPLSFIDEVYVSVNKNNSKGHNQKAGFGTGFSLAHNYTESFSVMIGLDYAQSNVYVEKHNTDNKFFIGYTNTNFRFHYLGMPLIVRKSFGLDNRLLLDFGPYFGFDIGSKINGTYTSFNFSGSNPQFNTNVLNRTTEASFIPGIHLGFGYNISLLKEYSVIINPYLRILSAFERGAGPEKKITGSHAAISLRFSRNKFTID